MKILFTFCLITVSSMAFGAELRLEDYLEQVKNKNLNIQAARQSADAGASKSVKSNVMVFPSAFGEAKRMSDSRETQSSVFQGTKNTLMAYQFGFSEVTPIGLEGRVYYEILNTEITGASPLFLPLNKYSDSRVVAELKQSLWKNFFGETTRAQQNALDAQALVQTYEQRYAIRGLLAEAELAYWRLSLAQEGLVVAEEALKRGSRIKSWSERRQTLQLADKSDYLQAEANYRVRELELQSAQDELRSASQAFNNGRNVASDQVVEILENLSKKQIEQLKIPSRGDRRDDVRATAERARLASANASLELANLTPNLELFGSYSTNGRDADLSPSMSESMQFKYPMWVAGVRFSAPLQIGAVLESRRGHKLDAIAAETALSRKLFDQEREWEDLTKQFMESKKRYLLARAIEETQKEKVEHERMRLDRGRTTTYQVLMFEQDYSVAQLTRIRTEADVLRVVARMKLFSGETL